MSRSYREPWFFDTYGSRSRRFSKRLANRTIRNTRDIPDGKAYRKVFDSWDISDYKSLWNKNWHWIPEWKARRK